jgi:hypothetical protein
MIPVRDVYSGFQIRIIFIPGPDQGVNKPADPDPDPQHCLQVDKKKFSKFSDITVFFKQREHR